MSGQAPSVKKFEAVVPGVAQAADETTVICEAPFAGTVTSVSYIPDTAIVGADDDTRKVALVNKGAAGAGSTEVAALQFDDNVDATAFDEKAITLSATAADLVVAAGDVLAFASTDVGDGLADPGGTVIVEISRS